MTKDQLSKALTYEQYLQLIDQLVAEKKSTGPIQNEALAHYTMLNARRMSRLAKTTVLSSALKDIAQQFAYPTLCVMLTEGWCGDAAQITPFFHKVAKEAGDKLNLQVLLRDENLAVMDQYLNNGGRSIPKMILIDQDTFTELGSWGPRPAQAQEVYNTLRAAETPLPKLVEAMQRWYNQDKGAEIQRELVDFLQQAQHRQTEIRR